MTPSDVVDTLLRDTRLDNTSVNAAMRSWATLIKELRAEPRSPLTPRDVARVRLILQGLADALNRAASKKPSRLRVVKNEDEG